ncbi:phosphatase PAP2 family protein [Hymenobacter taeanensis]|uniref:Phosphatase PAP2 family protein n=1 Tax=Hymenobacter taeanensis TaxID=2735321 RepID=A0A6M6BI78_9BACT|nr:MULTISPECIES: phosphatase PAP2 family protein [Hymenobacter]QJX47710.1 phosphatase PAP2 family protein [Hymenobacter taeanensis]UOQ82805.1 phosphatase PAP2 family protein [Hymenobacter sp. 5414T-23]
MKRLTARLAALFSFLTLEIALVGVVFMASALLFFYLTRVVFVENSIDFDQWAFRRVDQLRSWWPGLTSAVEGVTFFASLPFLVGAGIGLPLLLRSQGHHREGLEVFLAVAGAALFNQLLKAHFHRARPSSALFPQAGQSFPSGHAMIGLALYGCLAWLLWRHRRHPVWAAALLAWALLIGLTRVYLHVHYATDVLAGFAIGLVWLILLRTALQLWWREKAEAKL